MAAIVLELIALVFFHESYIPTILQHKLKRVQREKPHQDWYTVLDLEPVNTGKGKAAKVIESATRPSRSPLSCTRCRVLTPTVIYGTLDPALFLMSLYYALIFGVLYLVIVTVSTIFNYGRKIIS